jgi:hypothetical protein
VDLVGSGNQRWQVEKCHYCGSSALLLLVGGFVFAKETITLLLKLLSPLGRFYAGVILGFLGMLGFKRRQKGRFRLTNFNLRRPTCSKTGWQTCERVKGRW